MIRLYTAPGSQSCRKAKLWLTNRHMDFVEKNILSTSLQEDELREFLKDINPLEVTPMEALKLLDEIKRMS